MKIKSVGAVMAGIAANLLAIPVDLGLHGLGLFPAPGEESGESPYVLALAYRTAFAILGGWVTGRLAPSTPTTHAWIVGAIGALFAGLGAAAQWELGHHWYSIALVVMSVPATLGGARVFTGRRP